MSIVSPYLATYSPGSYYTWSNHVALQEWHVGKAKTVKPNTKMAVVIISMALVHHKVVNKTFVILLQIWLELKQNDNNK